MSTLQFFFWYLGTENTIFDYVAHLCTDITLKWSYANFSMKAGGSINEPQKLKFSPKKYIKIAVTCKILKISKNWLYHWIPWVFLHIFRYLTRSLKFFVNPPFFTPPGDQKQQFWRGRRTFPFMVHLKLHVGTCKTFVGPSYQIGAYIPY